MATKTFELPVLVSLINGVMFRGTIQEQIDELVQHVLGEDASVTDADNVDRAIDFVVQNNPKAKQAAGAVAMAGGHVDQGRWNKMIDMFRLKHEVGSLVQEEMALEA